MKRNNNKHRIYLVGLSNLFLSRSELLRKAQRLATLRFLDCDCPVHISLSEKRSLCNTSLLPHISPRLLLSRSHRSRSGRPLQLVSFVPIAAQQMPQSQPHRQRCSPRTWRKNSPIEHWRLAIDGGSVPELVAEPFTSQANWMENATRREIQFPAIDRRFRPEQ